MELGLLAEDARLSQQVPWLKVPLLSTNNSAWRSALLLRVISLARLHDEVFIGGGQRDPVITRAGDGLVGRVAQAVLVAQLLFDLGVDLIDGLFLGHFKESAAGFTRDALQNLLAIRMGGLLRISTAAGTAAHSTTPTAVAAHASTHAARIALVAVGFRIGVEDGIHQRVGALRGFDGAIQTDFATGIDTVRENDERLAPLLLSRHFVGGEEHRVIQCGTSAPVMPTAATPTA